CDLPDRVGSHFRRQIEFIAHYADRPRHRFLGFRSSSVLLVGAGDAFVAALTGLINNGLERVAVSGGESSWRSWPGVDGALDTLRSAGVGPAVREVDADDVRLGSFDLVLHCSDGGDPRQVLQLLERCWSEGTAFLPMSCAVQRMVVGPLTVPGGSPCWMCSRIRLSEAAEASLSAAAWRDLALGGAMSEPPRVSAVLSRMLGNAVAFQAFCHLP